MTALQWRHNGRDSVSNHQPHDCLLNRLFRRRSKKTSKLRVTGLCAGNSPGTGEFPANMASHVDFFFHLMTSSWCQRTGSTRLQWKFIRKADNAVWGVMNVIPSINLPVSNWHLNTVQRHYQIYWELATHAVKQMTSHEVETFSALLTICEGNTLVIDLGRHWSWLC